jgi:bifunctional non-homologous end joining protein LigD
MDPYEHAIKPMLAEALREPFDSPDHVFEVKWDGTRAIAFLRGGSQRFQNRRFNDITSRYPELRVRTRKDAILDGEVVVLANGIPSFERLQEREHTGDRIRIEYLAKRSPATYVVFDVLYVEKEDVTALPLERRKELLRELVVEEGNVAISETIDARGIDFFRAAVDRGLEGIIAKRKGSRYHMGRRSRDWIKIKKSISLDCVVCGVTRGAGERAATFGALVLGVYRGGTLSYVGRVGTGFDEGTRQEILARLRPFAADACPFPEVPETEDPIDFWARPGLVVEARFLEWSKDGHLRAPTFGRIRPDKDPRECVVS